MPVLARRKKLPTFKRYRTTMQWFKRLDVFFKNWHHAAVNGSLAEYYEKKESIGYHGTNRSVSRMRVLYDFGATHTLLYTLTHGNVRGKRILQLGGSAGVYAHYLQRKGAQAVSIDIDHGALEYAKKRGVRMNVRGSGVTPTVAWKRRKDGSEEMHYTINRLPFRSRSFDFIVSDHFLFSNYLVRDRSQPGFELGSGDSVVSETTLLELNRILKKGGRVIVTTMHPDNLPQLKKYVEVFKIH